MKSAGARALLALACLALGACTSTPPHRDMEAPPTPVTPVVAPPAQDSAPAPSEVPPDLASTPDAVPKDEPRSATGNPDSYDALGQHYHVLTDSRGFSERGYCSWYGKKFQGKKTSSGEPYDMYKMTAAHRTLPIPCYARVTNLSNGKSVIVRINDRGPFKRDRIVDISYAAALKLGILGNGQAKVQLDVVSPDAPAPPPVAASAATPAATIAPPPASNGAANPAATTSASAHPAGASARFLQAGTFSDAVNAATLRAQLVALGINNIELHSDQRGDHMVYRVLVGPFTDGAALEQTRSQLTSQQVPCWPVNE